HVGRFVLDGNVNPKHVWYRTQLDQDVAFNKNLDYYFGWISKFDSTYHLGTTQAAVTKYFFDLEAQLAEHPVTFTSSDGSTVAVGPDELVDNIQNAGYTRSQARWNLYAHALSAFKAGDVATFAGTFGAQTTGGADDNLFAVYNAVQCSDTQWPQSFARWQA